MDFDKELFAEILNKAKGERSINNYGTFSKVDPGYISRLLRCLVDSPPSAAVINKLANKAHNNVTLEELMQAAGYLNETPNTEKTVPDSGRAYYGGGSDWTEEEKEFADLAVEAYRKQKAEREKKKRGDT